MEENSDHNTPAARARITTANNQLYKIYKVIIYNAVIMASAKNVQDLVSAAVSMPGGGSAELYSDTAAQVCRRSLDELFSGKIIFTLIKLQSCKYCTYGSLVNPRKMQRDGFMALQILYKFPMRTIAIAKNIFRI